MKIKEFMKELYESTENTPEFYTNTCDTRKAGDPERELTKAATAMFATPEVVRAARAWGAELLIVHEPTYYTHMDVDKTGDPVYDLKKKFIEDSGVAIYRFHDHPHYRHLDLISEGECHYSGLKGQWERGKSFGINRLTLDEPMTAKSIAATLEKNLNIRHIRICGAPDMLCRRLALAFGTPGDVERNLLENDIMLTGEINEWAFGEYVRDMCQLGMNRAVLVLGHIGSERDGMRLLAERIPLQFNGIESKYFECGEAYTYTD